MATKHEYTDNRYIQRYDDRFHGWAVRLCRNNRLFVRYVPISTCGGSYDKALEVARTIRTNILCELAEPDADIEEIFAYYRKNNERKYA